jgi:hypothetical protein
VAAVLAGGDLGGDQHTKRENKRQEAERGAAKLASQHPLLPQNFRPSGAVSRDFGQEILPRI